MGVEASEIEVRLRRDDPRSRTELLADIRERLDAVPGIQYDVGQPISHRIAHMISGQRSALAIKVVGEDLDLLRRSAERIREVIAGVDGLVDLRVEQVVDIPQLVVRIDADAAALYGLSAGEAAEAVGTALWGAVAGHVYEDGTATEIRVRYEDSARADLEAVRRTVIPTPSGALVPVSALADVRRDVGPNYVLRENVQRRVVVSANAGDRDLGSIVDEVQQRIRDDANLPEGVHVEYSGELESERSALTQLTLLGALALFGIALVVMTTLGSGRRTLIVLLNLPLALVGGVVGVYASGGVLSVASVIGFIALFGIATRNGILLATRARDLELEGNERTLAVERASKERLAPIMMTAVTAALGLLPLALAMGEPGSEIQAPMAVVILCGLATSTALNMIVVPPLIAHWGGKTTQ